MQFRSDINGLRAVAVLLVVLFHFGVAPVSGGFIGVDVFFVISGYLMTGIIVSRSLAGRFSFATFYLERCRRIVPALAVLCVAMLAVGWFLLMPGEYVSLGKQVIAALTFVSNVLFWKEAGYFHESAHDLWLLHTWSLSTEWQFYLLYPILLAVLARFASLAAWRWVILAAAALSLVIAVLGSLHSASGAFYLLPARVWEMLAGALVYLFPLTLAVTQRRALAWVGLALVLAAALLVNEQDLWPGYLALVPVAGSALFIAAAHERCALTDNRIAQYLGRTSYSVYLWHWPIVVWLDYFSLESQPAWLAIGMLASLAAGHLSYMFVELGATRSAGLLRRTQPAAKLGMLFGVVLAAMLTVVASGVPVRLSANFRQASAQLSMPIITNGWCFYSVETITTLPVGNRGQLCRLGARDGELKALLIGDSFAGHYAPFWDAIGNTLSIDVQSVASDWCFPSEGLAFTGPTSSRAYEQCQLNRAYLKAGIERYDLIIFAGSWGVIRNQQKMDGVYHAIQLTSGRAPLLVVMPTPTNFDVNVADRYARTLLFDIPFDIGKYGKQRDVSARLANAELQAQVSDVANIMFLARDDLFHIGGAPSDVTRDNVPFGLDESGHLSIYGSQQAAEAFSETARYRSLVERLQRLRLQRAEMQMGRVGI
ncbi:peptidoglycan/LPS O-acetylase OafA/YrhL [Pseudomonas sp. BIGb0408]|uniref:Peptidoglycan/LPS O-acetylase OafA/YrhL n=1 Tax=Phytopseudomonas flavescens TaxID=29435 RepID=A0A7Z0BQ41_9GAMM|nr:MULTISPECIES: acyltransferase family protein [Pseudomonas]MCW2292657.1 peptidoglycan/LPS O-acetylase OafA/YrhL [Pseudomonas sp. BIGb0408]NYH72773.1 peptidoglycan/LPS O-acetylase OafA/YrhL [Pseudomonas flavescens]